MDREKLKRANEIMNELKGSHEYLRLLKNATRLTFYDFAQIPHSRNISADSPVFIACRDIAISECEMRIAQLEKEFNEL